MKTKKEVARRLHMKGSTLNSLLNGSCGMSPSRAREMQDRTGIDKVVWLYPGEYDLHHHLERWCGEKINRKGRGRVK